MRSFIFRYRHKFSIILLKSFVRLSVTVSVHITHFSIIVNSVKTRKKCSFNSQKVFPIPQCFSIPFNVTCLISQTNLGISKWVGWRHEDLQRRSLWFRFHRKRSLAYKKEGTNEIFDLAFNDLRTIPVPSMTSSQVICCWDAVVSCQCIDSQRISSTIWYRNSFMCAPITRVLVKDMTS